VLLLCEENKPRTMTHQNHQTNGASLEDCHTNFYALVSSSCFFFAFAIVFIFRSEVVKFMTTVIKTFSGSSRSICGDNDKQLWLTGGVFALAANR